ncbi:unnamed protein product [Adineta steineri]|uniref:Uncharacterized protein n=1 Tax=Adineta steineri TaxID=433720 RepID=A0A815SDQ5_9BILA|nr:unnamed protein product [Adineta steineri]CAF1640732.1 unnamed protein product [Adineta steineri]
MASQLSTSDNRIHEHHYSNVQYNNYYNIVNNYNDDHYDSHRMNNRYHHRRHRPQSPRYHMNNSNHINSNCDNGNWDLTISSRKNDGKTPIYPYLELDAVNKWFQANTHDIFNVLSKPYIRGYMLGASIFHDEWYRNSYELSVWEEYLKMGTEKKFWVEEVLRYTNTYNCNTNIRFIQTQIKKFNDIITISRNNFEDFQSEVLTYWNNDRTIPVRQLSTTSSSFNMEETITTTTQKPTIDSFIELNFSVQDYILQRTKYAKKLAETKIQLAQAQLEDFHLS